MDKSEKRKDKAEDKDSPEPLDARLLGDAVAELNVSRKNVGLYPPGHHFITSTIKSALAQLMEIFKTRPEITLGIARSSLLVDGATLDKKNPAHQEAALFFSDLGLSAITFVSGVSERELVAFHELTTMKDAPVGEALIEAASTRGISHIRLHPIDFSSFAFREGGADSGGRDEARLWEDYLKGFMEGTLASSAAAPPKTDLPPEKVAEVLNRAAASAADGIPVDGIVESYIKGPRGQKLSMQSVERLVTLIDHLDPDLKQRFLSKSFESLSADVKEVEGLLGTLNKESFERMVRFFTDNISSIPESLKNVLYKFSSIKASSTFPFDMVFEGKAVVHDIEMGDDLVSLFNENHFDRYVSAEYKHQLERLVNASHGERAPWIEKLKAAYHDDVIDGVSSEIMIEVIESPTLTREACLTIMTRLTELASEFVETGRFEDALNIYTAIYSHSHHGAFSHEAASTIEYFFHTEGFIARLVEALVLMGRNRRKEAFRIVRAMKSRLIGPLFDALIGDENAGNRKFLLDILITLNSDVLPDAVRLLKDKRWYVVRNMVYLIRHCDAQGKYLPEVRKFAKDEKPQVCIEAVRTLLHFKSKDAIAFLKLHMDSKNLDLREQALKMAGSFKVREVLPSLIEQLRRKESPGMNAYMKTPVVQALGEIAAPEALPHLKKIMKSGSFFKAADLDDLKAEIVKTLAKYPPSEALPIAALALDSQNETLKALAKGVYEKLSAKEAGPNA